MLKYVTAILIVLSVLTSASFGQFKKLNDGKMQILKQSRVEQQSSTFYGDYQARKISTLAKTGAATKDLMFATYDWIYNAYNPPMLVMYDITGDGVKDPIAIGTNNTPTRYAQLGYIDDIGTNSYPLYGTNAEGAILRTGSNSMIMLDETNGALYAATYDFLFNGSDLNEYVWAIDLATDITAPTRVTTEGSYIGGWPRMTKLAGDVFFSIDDNTEDGNFRIMKSTDGGVTFAEVGMLGKGDSKFWFNALASDPLIESDGNSKISIITGIEKVDVMEDVYSGVTDEDSANCMYHYYSTDAGATWQGEIFELDGKSGQILNRPDHWSTVQSWDNGDYNVDPTGVTHLVHLGVNSVGINANSDTINIYPMYYWNDKDKNWIAISDTATKYNDPIPDGVTYDRPANMLGNSAPSVAISEDGKVVVAIWVIPEYSGEWGHSAINSYPGDGGANSVEIYFTDIVYAYSQDGGKTWSAPEALEDTKNYPEQWPNLAPIVEVDGDQATINYMVYIDPIPGSSIVGPDNSASPDAKWVYNSKTFTLGAVGVADGGTVIKNYSLEQNYPNPFNPATEIKFTLAKSGNVSLKVFDILGREVASLVNGEVEAGSHSINFDASNLSSGVYLYTINAENFSMTKKMMLMK